MAQSLSTLNQIAAKRLSGKAMSNATLSLAQEKFGSTVQTLNTTVFGESLPNDPSNTFSSDYGIVQSASAGDPGTIMLMEFEVRPDADSAYDNDTYDDANSDAGENPFGDFTEGDSSIQYANTYHAYHLRLTGSFETDINETYFNDNASTAIAHGAAPFQNNYHMSASRGGLQIVPEYASNIAGANNAYVPTIISTDGSTISSTSGIDWYLDTYSGILFVQDPTSFDGVDGGGAIDGGGNSSATVPARIRAFVYVGKYQNAISGGDTVDIHFSGSGGGFSLANAGTASFEGTANEVEVTADSDSINIGLPDNVIMQTASINNNLTVGGDLIVQGTTTTINTDNLLVEDRYILLGSSSLENTVGGGIIVQKDSTTDGTALHWDDDNQVWAVNIGSADASTADIGDGDLPLVLVSSSATAPTGNPQVGASNDYRYGQMYVDTSDTTDGGLYVFLPS